MPAVQCCQRLACRSKGSSARNGAPLPRAGLGPELMVQADVLTAHQLGLVVVTLLPHLVA